MEDHIQVRDEADHVAVSMPTNASSAEDNNAPENILFMQLAGVSEMDDHVHKKLTKTPHGIEEIRAIRDTTNRVTNNYNIDSSTHVNSRCLNIKFVIV